MRSLFEKLASLKKRLCKVWDRPLYIFTYLKIYRLYKTPRFQMTHTGLLGKDLLVADAASTVFMYKEIFENEIYKFKADKSEPRIVDCGANIGMSIIYFKKLYPAAKIIAFEPDKRIYDICQRNIQAFQLPEVELVNKALWSERTTLNFYAEGADGGRLVQVGDNKNIVKVETDVLSGYLGQPVDLLKMDIEGAELEVLRESEKSLYNVERIFVEYHSFVGKKQKLDEMLAILARSGFRIHVQVPGIISPQPFCEHKNWAGMDLQLNLFAFRE